METVGDRKQWKSFFVFLHNKSNSITNLAANDSLSSKEAKFCLSVKALNKRSRNRLAQIYYTTFSIIR